MADLASTVLSLIVAGFGIVFAIGARMLIRGYLHRLRGML